MVNDLPSTLHTWLVGSQCKWANAVDKHVANAVEQLCQGRPPHSAHFKPCREVHVHAFHALRHVVLVVVLFESHSSWEGQRAIDNQRHGSVVRWVAKRQAVDELVHGRHEMVAEAAAKGPASNEHKPHRAVAQGDCTGHVGGSGEQRLDGRCRVIAIEGADPGAIFI